MNKVVYNGDYGGFCLSSTAIAWLEENACDDIKNFLKTEKEKEENKLSESELEYMTVSEILSYRLLSEYKIPRHHPDLVRCVEELGSKANGTYAYLCIANIEGNTYRIDEYDGYETVIEPEDYKWITI